jgi:translation initiation factor IF-2
VLRDSVVVFEGELESLRRFKDNVKEVKSGTECVSLVFLKDENGKSRWLFLTKPQPYLFVLRVRCKKP